MQEIPAEQKKETNKTQEANEAAANDDEMKYRVFNYGKGTVSLPYLNPVEKIQEFQRYLKKAIAESDLDSVKSRSILNSGSSEEISVLEAEFIDPKIEKLVFFFDTSPHETRDYGVALTTFGIHYKFYGERKGMPWKKLAEEYAIRADYGVQIIEPNSVMDEDADPVIDINLSQSGTGMLANRWLFNVICKGCDTFTEMEDGSVNAGSKKSTGETAGSILKRNLEGIIMSIIVSIIILTTNLSFISFILTPILSFVGYIIGNKIRLAVHPDFVIASGFMGLLKEKIFWRFIPQLIGCFIGGIIGAVIGRALF